MTKIEDCSSYIKVSKSAQDTDVGLREADLETSPKRSLKKAFQDISKLEYKYEDQKTQKTSSALEAL
ncbi:hypothetical protein Tco_1142027 [Tanacetum coccineum]